MAVPNIDMVAALLRSCSLGEDPGPSRPAAGNPASEGGAEGVAVAAEADTTLELNSEVALPYHWEQCLDLKTGRLYYMNWRTGAKSTEDPRKLAEFRGGSESDGEDNVEDDEDGDDADDEAGEDEGSQEEEPAGAGSDDDDGGYDNCSSAFSTSSSSSSSASSRDAMERGPVLVAAGCRACIMYVMVPKGAEECPRCGGRVICFGRGGS